MPTALETIELFRLALNSIMAGLPLRYEASEAMGSAAGGAAAGGATAGAGDRGDRAELGLDGVGTRAAAPLRVGLEHLRRARGRGGGGWRG